MVIASKTRAQLNYSACLSALCQRYFHTVNLTGPFIGTQLRVPNMRKVGGWSIVNISPIAGIVDGNGPAYTASNGGLKLLTKDKAVELAKDKIRVNSIHPGGVITPMTELLSS